MTNLNIKHEVSNRDLETNCFQSFKTILKILSVWTLKYVKFCQFEWNQNHQTGIFNTIYQVIVSLLKFYLS